MTMKAQAKSFSDRVNFHLSHELTLSVSLRVSPRAAAKKRQTAPHLVVENFEFRGDGSYVAVFLTLLFGSRGGGIFFGRRRSGFRTDGADLR